MNNSRDFIETNGDSTEINKNENLIEKSKKFKSKPGLPEEVLKSGQESVKTNIEISEKGKNQIKTKSPESLEAKTGYAIIIGISDYPGSSNDLSYCDDDALEIYSMLINDYNFRPENIIYLQDSNATKSAISSAFDTIAAQITPNDVFFFYYSGHGGFGTEEVGPFSEHRESEHPYDNYEDYTTSISHPGAAYMRVHFYRLETESGYDYLLCGDSDVYNDYYYELFSGYYGYNKWSSYIPVDRYYLRLVSDYSITDYGYRVDMYEAEMPDGTHYLCSYDSVPNSPDNYYLDSLIDSKLDEFNCDEKYVVIDSCHSGGLIPEVQSMGRYIMTAADDDEFSLEDSDRQNGCFTYNFLESINASSDTNGDGAISMEERYDYTYSETVSRSTSIGYTHHPQESDGISGESILSTQILDRGVSNSSNELFYSFDLFGTGKIENLDLLLYFRNSTDLIVDKRSLLLNATSTTGFESYEGSAQLKDVDSITGFGVFASIMGNELINLHFISNEDFDNDSVYDSLELYNNMNIGSNDTDMDGLDDYIEYYGETSPISNDTDADGLDDYIEYYGETSPISNDTDADGLSDAFEILFLLINATNPDTDGDGMGDGYEYYNELNYTIDDSGLDLDSDGLSNLLESQIGSYANDTDSDEDGMGDFYEYNHGLNSISDDSGLDLDSDGLCNLLEYQIGIYPNDSDSDGDGMGDGYEYYNNLNLMFNDSGQDFDSDGLCNILECQIGSVANLSDTDRDGLSDGAEYYTYGTDVLDRDTDGDGLSDGEEIQLFLDPLNPQSSMVSIVLNFGSVPVFSFIAAISIFLVKRQNEKKEQYKKTGHKPYALKNFYNSYNGLTVKQRTKPTYTRPYRGPYQRKNIRRVPSRSFSNLNPPQLKKYIKDFLNNKIPPPISIYDQRGNEALYIGYSAIEALKKQEFGKGLDLIFVALMKGVPEPLNSQLKSVLRQLANNLPSTSHRQYKSPSTSPNVSGKTKSPSSSMKSKLCPFCGAKNQIASVYCKDCGRRF